MKKEFLKESPYYTQTNSADECERKCRKHCKHCNRGIYYKETGDCIGYEKTDKSDADTILFKIKSDKKYKVNKVAFWITFSCFMVFVLILIYFLIRIFFLQS